MKSYLNIAAGKIYPIEFEDDEKNLLVQLDKMYWSINPPDAIEQNHEKWLKKLPFQNITHTNVDAFEFLGNYKYQFDNISCYRFLADIILNENITEGMYHADWERHDTLLTYELLNEPSMPHASIWTPQRLKYFFGLEERFKVLELNPDYVFDGRDIYIRAILKRIK